MTFDGINCAECGENEFRLTNDSILKRKFPFVRGDNLKICDSCGAKYITCDNCGNLFTRVHLSTDVWGVTDMCPSCGSTNDETKAWITRGHPRAGNERTITILFIFLPFLNIETAYFMFLFET